MDDTNITDILDHHMDTEEALDAFMLSADEVQEQDENSVHQSPSFDDDNVAGNAHPIHNPREFLANLYRQATTKTVGTYDYLQYVGHFDSMSLGRTKYFNCLQLVVPLLYWYTAYHAMLNDTKAVICPCELSNGLILVALWLVDM